MLVRFFAEGVFMTKPYMRCAEERAYSRRAGNRIGRASTAGHSPPSSEPGDSGYPSQKGFMVAIAIWF